MGGYARPFWCTFDVASVDTSYLRSRPGSSTLGTDLVEHVKHWVVDPLGWISTLWSLDRSDAVALAGRSRRDSRSGLWDDSDANPDAITHCFCHVLRAGTRKHGQCLGQGISFGVQRNGIGFSKPGGGRSTRVEKSLVLDRLTVAADCLRRILQILSKRTAAETMTNERSTRRGSISRTCGVRNLWSFWGVELVGFFMKMAYLFSLVNCLRGLNGVFCQRAFKTDMLIYQKSWKIL